MSDVEKDTEVTHGGVGLRGSQEAVTPTTRGRRTQTSRVTRDPQANDDAAADGSDADFEGHKKPGNQSKTHGCTTPGFLSRRILEGMSPGGTSLPGSRRFRGARDPSTAL